MSEELERARRTIELCSEVDKEESTTHLFRAYKHAKEVIRLNTELEELKAAVRWYHSYDSLEEKEVLQNVAEQNGGRAQVHAQTLLKVLEGE